MEAKKRTNGDGHQVKDLLQLKNTRYQLIEMLARGGYHGGEIWKVQDTKTGWLQAAKVMRNKPEELLKEAEIMRFLNRKDPQKFVVRVHTVFKDGDARCMILDLMTFDLHRWTKQSRPLGVPLKEIRVLASRIFGILKYMGEMGVLHGDMKVNNFLMASDHPGSLKLCDFGNATSGLRENDEMTHRTYGTMYFAAPEVILEYKTKWAHSLDTWAAGRILLELVLRTAAFPETTVAKDCQTRAENISYESFKKLGKPPLHVLEGCHNQAFRKLLDENSAQFPATFHNGPLQNQIITTLRRNAKVTGDKEGQMHSFCDLVKKVMLIDPDQRLRPSQALNHQFINYTPRIRY